MSQLLVTLISQPLQTETPSSVVTEVICFTQLLFQSVKYGRNLQGWFVLWVALPWVAKRDI